MKDICWGYVWSHIFPKRSGAKDCSRMYRIYIEFFLSDIFPTAYIFFIYFDRGGPAGGASLFAGLHDFCGLVESRTIASPPLERCGVSYRIFSRRGCQVVSWLYIGPRVWRNLSEPKKSSRLTGPLSRGMERIQHTRSLKPSSFFCRRAHIIVILIVHACSWSYT